jgi:DNA-binding transcriptional MerR regulator
MSAPKVGARKPGDGFRGPQVCKIVGITYRQLDYWARTELVRPSVCDAAGSGTQRLYSYTDLVELKVVKRLLDAGVSLQSVRKAIATLRRRGEDDLATMTLISDGRTVYQCRSVVDLVQGGQGVFAIAISGSFQEIQGSLARLPGRVVSTNDELLDDSVPPASPESDGAPDGAAELRRRQAV